jgi:hypothetical protein
LGVTADEREATMLKWCCVGRCHFLVASWMLTIGLDMAAYWTTTGFGSGQTYRREGGDAVDLERKR